MTGEILVTGGAGYIGSHMLKALKAEGASCVVLDDLSTGFRKNVLHGEFINASLLDKEKLEDVFARRRFSAVIHFAAASIVGESVGNPEKYYRNNVIGSKNLLDCMVKSGVKQIIFSSTAAVYGTPSATPIPETHALYPVNPYGASKLAVELMLRDYAATGAFRYVSLRYFNAAGADPEGEIGECHDPETHLIPIVLQAASGRRSGITVFGDDYDTPDGTCIRDYIHVTDLCRAHYLALRALENGDGSACFNLGTGKGHTVLEVIEKAKEVSGRNFEVKVAARRPGDPPSLVADCVLARKALGWKPERSGLERIIADAWQWELKMQTGGACRAGGER